MLTDNLRPKDGLRAINGPDMRGAGRRCTKGTAQRHSFLLPRCRGPLCAPDAERAFYGRRQRWVGSVL